MKNLYPINEADEDKIREDAKMLKISDLLKKHKQILELTAQGLTTIETGKQLFKSSRTIEIHVYEMMKATESKNKTALVATAIRLGIIN